MTEPMLMTKRLITFRHIELPHGSDEYMQVLVDDEVFWEGDEKDKFFREGYPPLHALLEEVFGAEVKTEVYDGEDKFAIETQARLDKEEDSWRAERDEEDRNTVTFTIPPDATHEYARAMRAFMATFPGRERGYR